MTDIEFCVVVPLARLSTLDRVDRRSWPRHVTVVPNFRADATDVDVLGAIIRERAAVSGAPVAIVAGDALFGAEADVPVQLVTSTDLHRLHGELSDAFDRATIIGRVAPAFSGLGYVPHVTVVGGERLVSGSALTIGRLALVEIGPDGHREQARVVAHADFGADADGPVVTAQAAAAMLEVLAGAGIQTWVIGGWGVDALLRRRTRDHHDIDVFVDVSSVRDLLDRVDEVRYLWSENRWSDGLPSAFVARIQGIDLDVHVIDTSDGGIRLLSEHSLELPPRALEAVGMIGGLQVRCATAEAQELMHTGYDLPPHQRRDLEALRDL